MTIFHEPLPSGELGAVRICAFTLVILGAASLARQQRGVPSAADGPAGDPGRVAFGS
jgi:hypothetical protein